MSGHSSSARRLNKIAAVCLSFALATGTVVVTSTSAPVAQAQETESGEDTGNNTDNGNNDSAVDDGAEEQPEVSSFDSSSVATDEESDLGRTVNALSFVLAVSGIVGIAASLVMHFAAMALPVVPWKN